MTKATICSIQSRQKTVIVKGIGWMEHSPNKQHAKKLSMPLKPEVSAYPVALNGLSSASTAILARLSPIRCQRIIPIPKKVTMIANASRNTSLTQCDEQERLEKSGVYHSISDAEG